MMYIWVDKKVGIALDVRNLKIISIIVAMLNVLFIKRNWNGEMKKIYSLDYPNIRIK